MLAKRIITCLDVKEGRTVKGVHFNDLKDAGDIVELAKKLVHIIIARKANTLKRVHYSLGFPMKSKCAFYTLYSAQCFIGMDCTELIFFLR